MLLPISRNVSLLSQFLCAALHGGAHRCNPDDATHLLMVRNSLTSAVHADGDMLPCANGNLVPTKHRDKFPLSTLTTS
jgi:hypothetical protein